VTVAQPPATPDAGQGTRNTWILMAAQALNGSGPVVAIALGGLAGSYLLGEDKTLATLPVSGMAFGLAAGALPAALLMQRIGRRLGLMTGAGFGIAGGLVAAGAIWAASFVLFAVALILVGVSNAFIQQYRFAAAEAVPPDLRGLAISRVMIGGIITALVAPQVILYTRDLLDPLPFAGAFVALSVIAVIGLAVLGRLHFPPRRTAAVSATPGEAPRQLSEIASQPRFLVALLCAAASFALMSFVMTAAPLAMVGSQHSEAEAVLGIQWHVIAMFAPSLITGRLIGWFGKETIVATGLILLITSALVGLAGMELLHFWGMLVLLGVGWNFSFVGATAMLTDTYRPSERGHVEGFNDLIVFGTVALASFFSGQVLATSGWDTINVIVLPVVAVVLAALLFMVFRNRQKRPA
jgi:predicted MFS family arabinose efflux permease